MLLDAASMLADRDRLSCPPEVLSRVLAGEAVLLHLASGEYFGMNEVASHVWEAIVRGTSFGDAVNAVTSEFEVDEAQARGDLQRFVEMLTAKGLCVVAREEG